MATYPTSPGALRVASVVQDQRRATDKLFQFTPLPKQLPFIRAVLTDEPPWEQWFLAANRAGKSAAGAYCGATLARFGPDDPKPAIGTSTVVYDRATSGWVIGPDFPTLRDVLMPTYFDNGYVLPTQQIGPLSRPPRSRTGAGTARSSSSNVARSWDLSRTSRTP